MRLASTDHAGPSRFLLAVVSSAILQGGVLAQGGDDCPSAQPIAGAGTFAFDNSSTTGDGQPDPLCNEFATNQIDNDVWFCWTADCSGPVTLATCGQTAVDTKLAVYDGCGCPQGSGILDCNDDTCGMQSEISWNAVAGNQYLIRVGTFPGAAGGPGNFTIQCPPPPLDVEVTQLSFIDDLGNPYFAFSDYGQLHLTTPGPGLDDILWVNAVIDGTWAIQNAALIEIDGPGSPNRYTYDFQITNTPGAPVTGVSVALTVTPDQLVLPPAVPATTVPVQEHLYHPGSTQTEANPFPIYLTPPPASNFVNVADPVTWKKVRRRKIQGVDEPLEHCTPGAFARSMDWMNRHYCLGLPDGNSTLQQIFDKLRNSAHMDTTSGKCFGGTNAGGACTMNGQCPGSFCRKGTFLWSRVGATGSTLNCADPTYGKMKAGIDKFIADKNLAGKLSVDCNIFKQQSATNPAVTPCDLFDDLARGKDVVLNWGYWTNNTTTNNNNRTGGHSITVVGAVKCGEKVQIFYRDDVNGRDKQGDGQADSGVKVACFVAGGASGWTVQGNRWEGYVAVCPTVETIVDAAVKWALEAADRALAVEEDLDAGVTPSEETLMEIQELALTILDLSCSLVRNAEDLEPDCPGVLALAVRIKMKAITLQLLSEFLREDPSQNTVDEMLAQIDSMLMQLDDMEQLLDDCFPPFTNYCVTGLSGAIIGVSPGTSPSVSANNFTLEATPVPNAFGLFYFGPEQFALPFGQGTRCVGGGVFRVPPPTQPTSPNLASRTIDLATPPGDVITPGSTWNFQYWFRLQPLSSFDLSDGLSVDFEP